MNLAVYDQIYSSVYKFVDVMIIGMFLVENDEIREKF